MDFLDELLEDDDPNLPYDESYSPYTKMCDTNYNKIQAFINLLIY